MRGKAKEEPYRPCHPGITPACAGKRRGSCRRMHRIWDHPRMCGEKAQRARGLNLILGSPPHVRGKEDRRTHTHKTHGITPACAGKSRIHRVCTDRHRDHPRMCGEKDFKSAHPSQQLGSPPRMRGKVLSYRAAPEYPGITPAYAGKRLKRSRSTVPPVAIVPLFPSVCNKPVVSDGSPAGRDAPLFLPAENAVPASPAYNLRSL